MKEDLELKYNITDTLFFVPPIIALFAYFIGGDSISGKVFMVCNVIGTALLIKLTNRVSSLSY